MQPPPKGDVVNWRFAIHSFAPRVMTRQHHHAALLGHRGIGCFASWERFCVADSKLIPRMHGIPSVLHPPQRKTSITTLTVLKFDKMGKGYTSISTFKAKPVLQAKAYESTENYPLNQQRLVGEFVPCDGKKTPDWFLYIWIFFTASIHGLIILPTSPISGKFWTFIRATKKHVHSMEVTSFLTTDLCIGIRKSLTYR